MDKYFDTLLKKLDQDSKEIIDSILTTNIILNQLTQFNLSDDILSILIDIPDLYQEKWGENFEYMSRYLKNMFNIIFKEHRIILLKEILDKVIYVSKILGYDYDLQSLYEVLNNQSIDNKDFKYISTNVVSFGTRVDNNENDLNTDLKVLMINLNVFTFSNCKVGPIYVLFEVSKSEKNNLKLIGLLSNIENQLLIKEIQNNAIIVKITHNINYTSYGVLYFNLKHIKYICRYFKSIKINKFPDFNLSSYDNIKFDYSLPIIVDKYFRHLLSNNLRHFRVQPILQELGVTSDNYQSYLKDAITESIELIKMRIFLPKYIFNPKFEYSKLENEIAFIIPLFLKKNTRRADLFLILNLGKEKERNLSDFIKFGNNSKNKEHYYISTVLEAYMIFPLCRIFGPIQEDWILNSEDHKITLDSKIRAKYDIDIASIKNNLMSGIIENIFPDNNNNYYGIIKIFYLEKESRFLFSIKNLPKRFFQCIAANIKIIGNKYKLILNLLLQEEVSFKMGEILHEYNNLNLNYKKYFPNEENIPIAFANSIKFEDIRFIHTIISLNCIELNGKITKIEKYYAFVTNYYKDKSLWFFIRKENLPIEIVWLIDKNLEKECLNLNLTFKISNEQKSSRRALEVCDVSLIEKDREKIKEVIDNESKIRSQHREKQKSFEIEQDLEIYQEISNEISILKKDPNYYYSDSKWFEILELYSSLNYLRGKISSCFEYFS